jgi:hypothetical protein
VYRSRDVSLALVGLFVWLSGCTSYKHIETADVAEHGVVRVTLRDGRRTTLREAAVVGDSISGYAREGRPRPEDVHRTFALDEVSVAEAKGPDVAGTVVLAVLGAGLVAAVIAASTYEMCILSC